MIKHHLNAFIDEFKWALSSRSEYLRELRVDPTTLTDIQRAARFYYLQKLAFGGKTHGQTYGTATTSPPRLNLLRIEEDMSAAHLRLTRTNIESLPWQKVVDKYDRAHTFFYLDPPYWQTAGYGDEFNIEEYEEMAKLAKSIKGKMMISLNDHPDIREIFTDLNIKTTDINYTVGGGQNRKKATEVIITNY